MSGILVKARGLVYLGADMEIEKEGEGDAYLAVLLTNRHDVSMRAQLDLKQAEAFAKAILKMLNPGELR